MPGDEEETELGDLSDVFAPTEDEDEEGDELGDMTPRESALEDFFTSGKAGDYKAAAKALDRAMAFGPEKDDEEEPASELDLGEDEEEDDDELAGF
jgi:hypothetical protein